VSHCVTCYGCHTCDKYHCRVSLVIKCVVGGLLVTDFNDIGGGGGESQFKEGYKGWGDRPFSGERVGGVPLFSVQEKLKLTFWVIFSILGLRRCQNAKKNRSKQPI
jgi:hypothetical protein